MSARLVPCGSPLPAFPNPFLIESITASEWRRGQPFERRDHLPRVERFILRVPLTARPDLLPHALKDADLLRGTEEASWLPIRNRLTTHRNCIHRFACHRHTP